MRRVWNFMLGAVLGGVVGATLGLLLAPEAGDDLRAAMQARVAQLRAEMQQAAAARQAELKQQLETLRRPPTA